MKINYKATNFDLSAEVQGYFEKRIESVGKVIDIENPTLFLAVELGRTSEHHQQGKIFRAEVNLEIDGDVFRSVSVKEDIMSAIDEAKDDLVRELRKRKGKRMSIFRKGRKKIKDIMKGFYSK